MAKEKKQSNTNLLAIIIPVCIAVAVLIGLVISGRVTANRDKTNPTVTATKAAVTESQTQSQDTKVTLVAVGDNLIHNTLIDAGKQDDGNLDYSSFYENISGYIKSADIACINQETMLGGSDFDYQGYPLFNTPWEVGEAAINAGFDVFTCATNHSLDVQKFAGIEKECEFFEKHPEVVHIGTNKTEEEYNTITYYEKNGIKFALLNYTYGTNGISVPEDKPWCVNMLDEDKVKADLKKARANADCVIVFPHWGTENSHEINDLQKKYVKIFSDGGADIVIGTHPHVLEPVEWVTNEATGKKMIVYYSIGNFISHQTNLNQMCGGMAELTVERVDGKIQVTSAKLAPVVDFYHNTGNGYRFSVYRLSDYTDDIASDQAKDGASVKYFTDLSKKIIGEEFLDLN